MMYTESLITVYPHKTHKGLYVIIMERTYNPDGLRRYLQSNNLGSAHDKGVATVGNEKYDEIILKPKNNQNTRTVFQEIWGEIHQWNPAITKKEVEFIDENGDEVIL